MNHHRHVLALAPLALLSSLAQAQVQISGRIDLSLRYVDSGLNHQTVLQREGARSSKLTFQGMETLTDNLKAGFVLDTQVRADNGAAPSTFWERQAIVRLLGGWGEVRLGRDFALQNAIGGDFDALNGKGVGNMMNLATPFNFSNTNTYTRVNNAISYLSPVVSGFSGQVQLAPGEGASGNRHVAFGVLYSSKEAEVRFTHGVTDVNSVARVNPTTGLSTKVAASGRFGYSALGASYDFGSVKLLGSVLHWCSAREALTNETRTQRNINLGAMVPVGASGSVNVAYTTSHRAGLGSDDQGARQLALQYFHRLSKRTGLYASWSQINQSAKAAADTASDGARYNLDGFTVLGRRGQGADFGLVHAF